MMTFTHSRVQPVIFSDLDGTLLEYGTYSYELGLPAIEDLKSAGIPLIFCSSKTRSEQDSYRAAFALNDPYIVENGSAIVIPKGYFSFEFNYSRETDKHYIVELGIPYSQLTRMVNKAKWLARVEFRALEELSLSEICNFTGLSGPEARRASSREYSTTLISGDFQSPSFRAFTDLCAQAGLCCMQGTRFLTITSNQSDKGTAAEKLLALFRKEYQEIESFGLGDGHNDLPFLEVMQHAYLVQKHDGSWLEEGNESISRVEGIGPAGWLATVSDILAGFK